MHLADGILSDLPLIVGLNLVGGATVVCAARAARLDARGAAWTGTLGAFALAAQAVNVPLLPGTSAHAIGAGLLCLALGPANAIIALFSVLLVQALLYADGGITVLGINALTLAAIPVLSMALCRKLFASSSLGSSSLGSSSLGSSSLGLRAAAVVGTALGSCVGALFLALVLVFGADAPLYPTLAWLLGVQGLSGLAEGILTAIAVGALLHEAPALMLGANTASRRVALDAEPKKPARIPGVAVALAAFGLVLALVPLVFVPVSAKSPDALEVVVRDLGGAP